jgi:enoyl-CoA hydratase/carnithine racemase
VLSVVLNRPAKLNALTRGMIVRVRDALVAAQASPDVRAIVLRGAGRAFSVGDDLSGLASAAIAADEAAALVILQDVTRQIMAGPKPVVAAVQGWAVGAAFSWVLNCDHVFIARSTTAFFPELRWGVSPTGAATVLAPRMLGVAAARDAFLRLKRFSAADLLALGAVSGVTEDGGEYEATMSCARELSGRAVAALSGVKRLTNRFVLEELDSVLSQEAELAAATSGASEVASRIHTFQQREQT